MLKIVILLFLPLSFFVLSCNFSPILSTPSSSSTENKLRSRIDSIKIDENELEYVYSTRDEFDFYPKGLTSLRFDCATETSLGGLGPDYKYIKKQFEVENSGSVIKVNDEKGNFIYEFDYTNKIYYMNYRKLSDSYIQRDFPDKPIKPMSDSVYFVQFQDNDSINLSIVLDGLNFIQVFKENVGLVYFKSNEGYDTRNNYEECLLIQENGNDFAADSLMARLKLFTDILKDSLNSTSDLELTINKSNFDSIRWNKNISWSNTEKSEFLFLNDTIAKVSWDLLDEIVLKKGDSEYVFFNGDYDDSINKSYFSYDSLVITGDSVYSVGRHAFYNTLFQ